MLFNMSGRAMVLCLMVALGRADVVYVTDLTIFTSLAPCAADALSYNVMSQTYSNCPQAVTALQSCVCTKNNNFASIASELSSSVSYSCGSTASDDQASAATVLSAYCNQDSIQSFPTPTSPVSSYITDIPEFGMLPACISEQLSYAVMSMTYEFCPPDAPSLATCVCQKQQNSLAVSQTINTSVKSACSSHTAEISTAQAFFAAYCDLNSGSSAFPKPSNPPGDMSYYITDLQEFSSLAPCAQSALSYGVFTNTYNLCLPGPQGLASCACIMDGMSSYVSSLVTSEVKWECSSTNTEDISSALSVFDFYCSAARAEVTPAGVTASVAETSIAGPARTGSGARSSSPNATGTSSANGAGSTNGKDEQSKGPNVAVVAGAIIGVVGGLALIGLAVFFLMRNARKNRQAKPSQAPNGQDNDQQGKSELDSVPIMGAARISPPSPSPSTIKHNHSIRINNNISPVSAHSSAHVPPGTPELQGNTHPPMPPFQNSFALPTKVELQGHLYNPNTIHHSHAELQGQIPLPNSMPLPSHAVSYGYNAQPNRPELAGQMDNYGQLQYQAVSSQYGNSYTPSQQVYQADSRPIQPQRTAMQGMGWQSGPVAQYAELDGGYARDGIPHAR